MTVRDRSVRETGSSVVEIHLELTCREKKGEVRTSDLWLVLACVILFTIS